MGVAHKDGNNWANSKPWKSSFKIQSDLWSSSIWNSIIGKYSDKVNIFYFKKLHNSQSYKAHDLHFFKFTSSRVY